jgi:predicted protein tyrosine phosphatase
MGQRRCQAAHSIRLEVKKLLFICSRNKWRSSTAETIGRAWANYEVRSAGTSDSARIKVNEKLILWADLIFVMEAKHRSILRERFGPLLASKNPMVLDIPDDFQYMDPDLIELLEHRLFHYDLG